MEEIIVMYWLVWLIMIGSMLYFRNNGPKTMPPAMPVSPHRIAANPQITLI
jgi:hypothetical protein